ncbi:hypothetical protein B9Z55_026339 [Caenorhabditis nigoni]|uniref:Uncharacterized protein n=1 Tax=Caenorhabditis nigoni TaxID=1611254 RepID=A0A2G5T375_9PELO|nr:hypothetical protein B9Z55_026339 [Caenorhabditis nigoni]
MLGCITASKNSFGTTKTKNASEMEEGGQVEMKEEKGTVKEGGDGQHEKKKKQLRKVSANLGLQWGLWSSQQFTKGTGLISEPICDEQCPSEMGKEMDAEQCPEEEF